MVKDLDFPDNGVDKITAAIQSTSCGTKENLLVIAYDLVDVEKASL